MEEYVVRLRDGRIFVTTDYLMFQGLQWHTAPWWAFWTKGGWKPTGETWEPEKPKKYRTIANQVREGTFPDSHG